MKNRKVIKREILQIDCICRGQSLSSNYQRLKGKINRRKKKKKSRLKYKMKSEMRNHQLNLRDKAWEMKRNFTDWIPTREMANQYLL